MGKGAAVSISANGAKIAGGRLERTIPIQFSIGGGSAVDFTYTLPFAFTGKIEKVTIDLV